MVFVFLSLILVCPLSLSAPNSHFLLKGIFHIPKISKNLLSVLKFTGDIDVFFEFHPTFFVVKERYTRKVVLQGQNKNGLYCLDPRQHFSPSKPSAFLGECTTLDIWH